MQRYKIVGSQENNRTVQGYLFILELWEGERFGKRTSKSMSILLLYSVV